MPFIPASSSRWETQPDNRRCWPDVWGRRLCRQERGCLHFFRNSFHSLLSWTLDDINIMYLVISSACGAGHVSGCTSQECGLPVLLWALFVGCLSSPVHRPRPSWALGSAAHQRFPWAGENCFRCLLCPWGRWAAPLLGSILMHSQKSGFPDDCSVRSVG